MVDLGTIIEIIVVAFIPSIIALYVIINAIGNAIATFFSPKKEYEQLKIDLQNKTSALEKALNEQYDKLCAEKRDQYDKLEQKLNQDYSVKYSEMSKTLEKDRNLLMLVLSDKRQNNPTMARVFADYEWYIANRTALMLAIKKHPARKASDDVREYGLKNRILKQQNKELEYQLSFWENLFPWLSEFKEVSVDDITLSETDNDTSSEYDRLKSWLSPTEYNSLSDVEKYQLALDRYRQRKNKTKWEIGVEYERYIGYLYEKSQYKVEYRGALDGLQDMGRDLIASQGRTKYVIQCKYWSENKTIHEKHIFQLFGSVTLLQLQDNFSNISGIFVTSTKLSDIAKQVANALDIKVHENIPMSYDYPCIKCNVNKSTGEKIYHLPFDQQYDNCIIKKELGEFYAMTVKEAEDMGFRRAHRWHGNP